MKTRHKKDKIPLDGDVIPYDFHKYHALGNDYIVIDPNKTKAKLPAQRAELQSHSLKIKPTPIRFIEWS
jgi:diaminopimelate epimerase